MKFITLTFSVISRMLRRVLLASVFGCLCLTSAHGARNITFSWTPTTDDPPADGYRLYYKIGDPPEESNFAVAKASYDGVDSTGGNSSPIVIPGNDVSRYFLENLYEGKKYSFVLTAYRDDEESDPSGPIILEAIPEKVPPELIKVEEK